MQDSAAILLQLSEKTEQVVFAFDLTTQQFTFLNPAFEKLWRKRRTSVLNNPDVLLSTIHPEDRPLVLQNYHDLLAGNLIGNLEFRIQFRNHTERWVCLMPQVMEDHQVIGYAQDITASKRYQEVLKKFSDKKNSILNILSHDLAGPLANIQTLSKILETDVKQADNWEHIQQVIRLIEKSSKQGMQLIQDFIRQEFLESAAVDLIFTRVDLVARVKECMDEYQVSSQLTRQTFRFITDHEPIYVKLDDSKFMQAINNLMSNALKFTPDGGEITVTLAEKPETVLISIADNGIGIPKEYHSTLFDKFTRARRPGLQGEPSVGLGMSIIKTIVEWHHGQIWFDSQENQGTTFYIEIPKD